MPTYDFKCLDCDHSFTALLPAGTSETKCLKCGSPARKLLSAPAVHFKGSGFYSSGSKKSESNTKSEAPKSDSCCKDCKNCPKAD